MNPKHADISAAPSTPALSFARTVSVSRRVAQGGTLESEEGNPLPSPSPGRAVTRPRFLEGLNGKAEGGRISREPPRGPALSEPRSPGVPIGNPSVSAAGRRRGLSCPNRLLGPLKAYSFSQPALGEGRDISFPGGCASGGGPHNTGGDGKAWGTFHTLKLGGLRILAFKSRPTLVWPLRPPVFRQRGGCHADTDSGL